MRIRGWGWVLPALLMSGGGWGCASSDGSADAGVDGGYWGGQTGSLRPCSTPAFVPSEPSVPTGDAAIVFHTGCTTDVPFKITDANGEPVPFELEMLDDGVVLVKTDEALTPGTYQVETPDGAQKTMTVTDPVPLPATLGTLHKDGDCGARFLLTFDDAVVPYLPLMRLEYSVDGGPRSVWFEYGTIPSEGAARLEIAGIPHGNHRLEVFGLVAGEAMGPDALSQAFWAKPCTSDLEDNDRTFCSLDPGRAGAVRSGGGTALALFGVAVAVTRRRRRSPAAR